MFVVGALAGWWLDESFHTAPILVVVGTFLGIAGGMSYSVVQLKQFLRQ
jgi:F0F1-type ATP synthase assembly protein I